jgi:hypothetical protein
MSGWSSFGDTLTQILTGAGGALASNPNLVGQIVTAATSAANPNATQEDNALAQAEALFTVNPAMAILSIQKAIGMIPPSYLGVSLGLSAIKVDTPPLQAIQAIELARAALKKAPGA